MFNIKQKNFFINVQKNNKTYDCFWFSTIFRQKNYFSQFQVENNNNIINYIKCKRKIYNLNVNMHMGINSNHIDKKKLSYEFDLW